MKGRGVVRRRLWLTSLAVGSLVLLGVLAARPFASGAQESATPAVATDDDQGNATPVVGTPLLQPAIDLTRAQEIALDGQSGAVVTGVELDGDDGVLAYDVRLDNGTEVEIDATTGAILETEQAGADDENGDDGEHENADDDDGDHEDTADDNHDDGEEGENQG